MSARRIRVLHVIHHLQPGGMEYGLIKLVNALGPDIESIVCSTTTASPAMKAMLSRDVRVIELSRRNGNDLRLVSALFRVFRRERPDIVHTHAWGTLVEGYVAARLARVPCVIHGEHGTLQGSPRQIRVQRWLWRRVDRLLSVSSRLAERMAETMRLPVQRITVVRNGVDLARFGRTPRADARRALQADDDVVLIGHAGRLVDVKDQATLVAAAGRLKVRHERFRVLIAGDGPNRAALEASIDRHGVRDCVTLLGHQSDVEPLYAAIDVYVLCSLSEGMPNTILEAMASGVPVVSTRVGGADELVVDGETGLLVPAAQPERLAAALAELIASPVRRRTMGEAGRVRATALFSLPVMVEGYARLYTAGARRDGGELEKATCEDSGEC